MSVFKDQATFMEACGQTVGTHNQQQFEMYRTLIEEEFKEFIVAFESGDRVEMFDGLLDMMVVCIGAGHSAGFPMEAGWDTVALSNLKKIDPETGLVRRREDGKILKPEGWQPPTKKLARLIGESRG